MRHNNPKAPAQPARRTARSVPGAAWAGPTGPLRWHEIVARRGAEDLPFWPIYAELLAAAEVGAGLERSGVSMSRIDASAEVASSWSAWDADDADVDAELDWGEDALFVEEWFDVGEALQFSEEELDIEEPDRWERAVQWVRALLVAPA